MNICYYYVYMQYDKVFFFFVPTCNSYIENKNKMIIPSSLFFFDLLCIPFLKKEIYIYKMTVFFSRFVYFLVKKESTRISKNS